RTLGVDLTVPRPGAFSGSIVVESNDPDEPEARIAIDATAEALDPCVYEVSQTSRSSSLDLGIVELSRAKTRAVEIRNTGTSECVLFAARLLPGTDPS